MDLIDEQDGVGQLAQFRQQALQALLEVTTILGTRQQRAHVQRVHHGVADHIGHVFLDDALGQALGDGGLADAGLTDQQGVVLAPPCQNLHHPLELMITPDQGVDLAHAGLLVEVGGKTGQRIAAGLAAGFLGVLGLGSRRRRALAVAGDLGDPVGDVVDRIDPCHVLLLEEVDRLALLLGEDRNQYVGTGHFALARRLHVEHGPLKHSLEAQRRLGLALGLVFRNQRGGGIDEILQVGPQLVEIGPTGTQHI